MKPLADYSLLSPAVIVEAVEKAYALVPDGWMNPYPSYINRVYELQDQDGGRWVVKFYRPGRWSREALLEEHRFITECAEAEIPVVQPEVNREGGTLSRWGEYFFALFPKRGGRLFEIHEEEDYLRVGRLLGRLHRVGEQSIASHRFVLDPIEAGPLQLEQLLEVGELPPDLESRLIRIVVEALPAMKPLFEGAGRHRCHGDFHRGNILSRPETGLMVIDFDDMMTAPSAQDWWMILPGPLSESMREWNLLAEGYSEFRAVPPEAPSQVESLRFLRMLYFQAWCARQKSDHSFEKHFSGWGTEEFWEKEIRDFEIQREEMGI